MTAIGLRGRSVLILFVSVGLGFASVAGADRKAAPICVRAATEFRIPFPEGYTRAQMIARVATDAAIARCELRRAHAPANVALSSSAYAQASRSAPMPCFGRGRRANLEGFLFPSTYLFDARTVGQNLVANQFAAFCSVWSRLDLTYASSKNLTPYDVLKIASMVEAEAGTPGDRPKIAAVIYNRLRAGIPLGIDATLRYGLQIPPTESITTAELASNSPYNTRKRYGLPPTPIDNPGVASLEAAADPSRLGYLYFVRIPGTKQSAFFESSTAYFAYLKKHHYGPH
ncbi:MAG TPA: endolytic transglycosylase MltG [Gaiellaceae bacterium]